MQDFVVEWPKDYFNDDGTWRVANYPMPKTVVDPGYRAGLTDGIKLICPDIDPKFLELMVEEKMKEISK